PPRSGGRSAGRDRRQLVQRSSASKLGAEILIVDKGARLGSLCYSWIQGLSTGIEALMLKLWRQQAFEGQGLVEYGLIVVLIAIALISAVSLLAGDMASLLQSSG